MSIASDFINMAKEMLNDPEIGFDGTLILKTQEQTPQPWNPVITESEIPLRLFYTKEKDKTVNGSAIKQGDKVFITQTDIDLETCIGSAFIDHKGKRYTIGAVEPIGVADTTIISYVKIGS